MPGILVFSLALFDSAATIASNRSQNGAAVFGFPMAYQVPRVQILPLLYYLVSFQADGHKKLRWHFSSRYPRRFFFPLIDTQGKLFPEGEPAKPKRISR
jgi:hypothetical protein